jgi:protein involved in polysaccharide export with SLBB domain
MFSTTARILLTAMFFVASYATGQQDIDNAMAKELLKQRGYSINEAQLQKLTQDARSKSGPSRAKDADAKKTDTATAGTKDSIAEISMYENIINDKIIDPDKMLKTLPIFGLDVFRNTKPSTFTPEDYLATPADYPIGSGDEINILLWGRLNEQFRLKVDRDGRINIPHIGPVSVAGMPFSAMQKTILDRLQSIEGVQASITMGELRSIGVFIVGEVKTPGMYTVSALSNITNALFAASGPSKRGSLRNILLKRNGAQIATIDFYDFLLSGKDNASIRLKSGDVIMIPIIKKMVAVVGNVRRSAFYEIKEASTLKDVLGLAGGITPAAWTNRIQIERFQNNQYQAVLDIESGKNLAIPDFEIQDGDIIKIFPIVIKDKNAVYLGGNVYRPGKYEFKEGMKLSDLLPDYQSLLPETYFEYAMVLRTDPPNFLGKIIPFNLKLAMEDKNSSDNVPLQSRDAVMIYSRDYFEPDRTIFIGGAVTIAGKQKLLENMKIRDVIIKAGGLLEEASKERGELYRRVYNNEIVSTEKIEFNVGRALADDSQNNLVLKKFDMVYIRNKKGWEDEKHAQLKGEITYPGDYVLLSGETLGDLIERAGGFTRDAYLPAATLTRPSVKALERKRVDEYVNRLQGDALTVSTELMARQQAADVQTMLQQQQLVLNRLRDAESSGRVVIDLTNKEAYRGFILEDGDSLYVPKQVGTISVIGEVYNPATFRLESGLTTARYYIEMAGGVKQNADVKNIYIIKSNGSVITRKNVDVMEYALAPADAVVVPQKVEFKNNFKIFMDSLTAIVQISSLLLSAATVVIALRR